MDRAMNWTGHCTPMRQCSPRATVVNHFVRIRFKIISEDCIPAVSCRDQAIALRMQDQAASSLRNCAKERIDFIFTSRNPRRSSSPSRFSYRSLPNTSLRREPRESYLWLMSLRRSVRYCSNSHRSSGSVDLAGHLFCFLHHLLKLLLQSSVEGFAGDGFF
jgi:hypothetical protein